MKDGPAFQLYASDFYMDTNGWTATQIGIYFRLLMHEWINGSIPNDIQGLARIAQIDPGNFLKCYRPTVEGKFTPNGDGNLINKRLEDVRESQRIFRESQAEKGRKSAGKRWGDKVTGVITTVTERLQPEGQPEDNSSSSSSNKEKKIYKRKVLSDEEWTEQINKLHPWINWDDLNREMDTWLLNNPKRQKTRRFITNWILNKQKDKPMKENKKW